MYLEASHGKQCGEARQAVQGEPSSEGGAIVGRDLPALAIALGHVQKQLATHANDAGELAQDCRYPFAGDV